MSDKEKVEEVEQQLAEILDGDAPQSVYDAIAESDELRDLRHEAEQAAHLAGDAAADYVPPSELGDRVLSALDARGSDASPVPREPTLPAAGDGKRAQLLVEMSAPGADGTPAPNGPDAADSGAKGDASASAGEAAAAGRHSAAVRQEPEPTGVVSFALRRKSQLGVAAAVSVAAAAAAIALSSPPADPGPSAAVGEPWSGTVERVVGGGAAGTAFELCNHRGEACQPAAEGASVPAGAVARTNVGTRARLRMADGTEISLDRQSELALDGDEARRARLARGAVIADVAKVEGATARVDVPTGFVTVLGTKFALRVTDDSATVSVSRGVVSLNDGQDRSVMVRAGEEGQLYSGMAPYVTNAVSLGEALSWDDTSAERDQQEVITRGLGELRAKKPGSQEEQKGAVTLTSHKVRVRISGAMARTEVDETFTNHTGDVLEGIYRFPLPPDAKIERLALEVDGKLEEGAFVDRDRAASIWRGAIVQAAPKLRQQMQDEIVWVPGPWRDPALLEWQRGGRFELRIYPIPKNGSRRVVLTYTQLVRPTGGVRRYTYPMAHDPSGSTRVDRFDVDLQVRGHDNAFGVRTHGWEPTHEGSDPQLEKLSLSAQSFVPTGDLTVEYALPDRHAEVTAWAFQPSPAEGQPNLAPAAVTPSASSDSASPALDERSPYVAVALRPRLPRVAADEHRAFVLVVDASRSMFGENYRRATALTARIVREMDRPDMFTVLACDSSCRSLPGGLRPPSDQAAVEVQRFLASTQPEGASDVTEMIRSARSAASESPTRKLRIVYIGDGTPTSGPIRPAYVTQAVRDALAPGRGTVTAVAIGSDSDLDTLGAVARGGGGVVLPFVPGETTAEAAYAVLGAAYGSSLREVTVTLPEGLTSAAPAALDTIPAGGESILVARMTHNQVRGEVVLQGKVGQETFEQRYSVELNATNAPGNAFVPRLYAAARIGDLERRSDANAQKEAVALSSAFNVASRYTSLLVLESPAMFKAFGLDNTRRAPEWTGEEEAKGTLAQGETELDASDDDLGFDSRDLEWGGGGPVRPGAAGGGSAKRRSAPRGDPLSTLDSIGDSSAGVGVNGPSYSPSPASPPPPAARPSPRMEERAASDQAFEMVPPPVRSRRRMVPMRRVWDRKGSVSTDRTAPKAASPTAIAEAERELERDPNRREAVKRLYVLYALAGEVAKARPLAQKWSDKEPLDPEALTARADLAARSGNRDLAIRILGSVVDVRPDDVKSQKRLARLHRWAGREAAGCRHSIAIAQLRRKDAELLAEAVTCGRRTGHEQLVTSMLGDAEASVRAAAEAILAKPNPDRDELRGDLQLEATWTGSDHDLDLGLLHPDGHRVSWLGAPTREVITATDVESTNREGLALRGAKPGEYVVEVVRARGDGPVSGTVSVRVAGAKRDIPFTLVDNRLTLGIAKIRMQSRLVPLGGPRW